MIATPDAVSRAAFSPRACFFGAPPRSYERLNRELLGLAASHSLEAAPEPGDRAGFGAAAITGELDRVVKVVKLAAPIPVGLSSSAILGMERLRDLGILMALRGDRATDLPRPRGGRFAEDVRRHAPGLIELVNYIEERLSGSHRFVRLFVRSIKLDRARASTTAPSSDPTAANLHFDAERSSLNEYPEPVFQFYLNAGQLERQFRILPVLREDLFADFTASDRRSLPFEVLLEGYLAQHPPIFETIPVESGALAIFDGRQFAHDAGKADVESLAAGRFEPSSEPDLVIALDTIETGYHHGLYRPDLAFFEDSGLPEITKKT